MSNIIKFPDTASNDVTKPMHNEDNLIIFGVWKTYLERKRLTQKGLEFYMRERMWSPLAETVDVDEWLTKLRGSAIH